MKLHVMTLFPEMIMAGVNSSILKKASEKNLLQFDAVNIRDYSTDKHKKVDDYPYGGGAGMLMQAQPVYDAYCDITKDAKRKVRTIYLTPQGHTFSQKMAENFAKEDELIFLCGHYEGIDERVLEEIVTDYVSIGDYVLTGGELPALVMIDAIARLIPEVLHNDVSAETESFQRDLLEYPQYSRPEVWRGKEVPKVLLSGDHKKIVAWRQEEAEKRTRERRPDLYQKYCHVEDVIQAMKKKKRSFFHMMESLRTGRGQICYEGKNVLSLGIYEKVSNELFLENIEKDTWNMLFENYLVDGSLSQNVEKSMQGSAQVSMFELLEDLNGGFDEDSAALYIVVSDEEYKDYLMTSVGCSLEEKEALGCYTRKEAIYQKRKDIQPEQDENWKYKFVCREGDEVIGIVAGKCLGRIDFLWVKDWEKNEEVAKSLFAAAVNEALLGDVTAVIRLPENMSQAIKTAMDCGIIFSEKCLWKMRLPLKLKKQEK